MKTHLFLTTLCLSILGFVTTTYGQNKGSSKKQKTYCIKIDAKNCCDGTNEVPACIPENSTLGIMVYNVNPFKTTVSASGITSVIDFGNDSLFSFNLSAAADKNASPASVPDSSKSNFSAKNKKGKNKKSPDCCKALDVIKKTLQKDNEAAAAKI